MQTDSTIDPNQHITIVPVNTWKVLDLKEIWQYRELLFFLAWRDIKVRYKQTVLGALWALLQPLLTMALFSVIFGLLLKVDTEGAPYPIFAFTALLPWQLFAFALMHASNSLVNDRNLVTKVYFPRVLVPLASVVAGLADFVVSFIILIGMLFLYGIPVTNRILSLPAFVLLALASALLVSAVPASADEAEDLETCRTGNEAPAERVEACTRLIDAAGLEPADLLLYKKSASNTKVT